MSSRFEEAHVHCFAALHLEFKGVGSVRDVGGKSTKMAHGKNGKFAKSKNTCCDTGQRKTPATKRLIQARTKEEIDAASVNTIHPIQQNPT